MTGRHFYFYLAGSLFLHGNPLPTVLKSLDDQSVRKGDGNSEMFGNLAQFLPLKPVHLDRDTGSVGKLGKGAHNRAQIITIKQGFFRGRRIRGYGFNRPACIENPAFEYSPSRPVQSKISNDLPKVTNRLIKRPIGYRRTPSEKSFLNNILTTSTITNDRRRVVYKLNAVNHVFI